MWVAVNPLTFGLNLAVVSVKEQNYGNKHLRFYDGEKLVYCFKLIISSCIQKPIAVCLSQQPSLGYTPAGANNRIDFREICPDKPFLLLLLSRNSSDSGPLHTSPVDRAGSVTGMNFALDSYEKLEPGFRDKKRSKILGTSSCAKFGKQSKHAETQNFNFRAYLTIGNS